MLFLHRVPACWYYSQEELKIKPIARLNVTSSPKINPALILQKKIVGLTSPALKLGVLDKWHPDKLPEMVLAALIKELCELLA